LTADVLLIATLSLAVAAGKPSTGREHVAELARLEREGPAAAQLFRAVFAKKGLKTCSTLRLLQLGHAGRFRPCSPSGSARSKTSPHAAQR
jgi:hypothetical protein